MRYFYLNSETLKRETLDLFLRKLNKFLLKTELLSLILLVTKEKYLLKKVTFQCIFDFAQVVLKLMFEAVCFAFLQKFREQAFVIFKFLMKSFFCLRIFYSYHFFSSALQPRPKYFETNVQFQVVFSWNLAQIVFISELS